MLLSGQRFGQDVCCHSGGFDVLHADVALTNVVADEVVAECDVLSVGVFCFLEDQLMAPPQRRKA